MTTKPDKYSHFEIGMTQWSDRRFRIFAGNLKAALKPARLTTAGIEKSPSHDVLCFNDKFILPADHLKRLLSTIPKWDTVLTFRFADDMKAVSIEIDEGRRPTVITFKNLLTVQNTVYRNYFIWDIDPALFPAQDAPELTPEPDPVVMVTETAVITPEPAQPTPEPEKQPDPMPVMATTPAKPKQPRKRRQMAQKDNLWILFRDIVKIVFDEAKTAVIAR